MKHTESITIICTPLRFYSPLDEDALFAWLKKIKSIKSVQGVGTELHLGFTTKELSCQDVWNLRGVFKRYNFNDKQQLHIFMNEDNKNLLQD